MKKEKNAKEYSEKNSLQRTILNAENGLLRNLLNTKVHYYTFTYLYT